MGPKKQGSAEGDSSIISTTGVDDYLLPRTVVQRLAKGVLPANTQIQKDAMTAILKSTTVFVNYLASNANDRAVLGNHKTIKPEDVLEALEEMEFEQFVPRVRAEHDTFVETANNKRNAYRKQQKDEKGGPDPAADNTDGPSETVIGVRVPGPANGVHADGDEPAAKRPRISDINGLLNDGDDNAATEDGDATEPEELDDGEDQAEEEEEEEEDPAEEFEDAEETQPANYGHHLDVDADIDDSNNYRRDANAESEEDDY